MFPAVSLAQISLALAFVCHLVDGQQTCSSPQSGTCINPKECAVIVEMSQDKSLSRDELISRLQQFRTCPQTYLVCCPRTTARETKTPTTTATSSLLPSRAECGKFKTDRIYNGEKSDILEHPWATLLQYRKGSKRDYKCGGTLISKRYVLTAAHCLDATTLDGWALLSVRLGETDYKKATECSETANRCNDPPVDIPVQDKILHEAYSGNDNDIALLRLSRNVQYTDFIQPICLPNGNDDESGDYFGRSPTAVGWGLYNFSSTSSWKLKGNMDVVPNNKCREIIARIQDKVTDKHLCAGTNGSLTCSGDSGGGLCLINDINNWVQIGIVSFGHYVCGREGFPSVFTRVSRYMDWIVSKIK